MENGFIFPEDLTFNTRKIFFSFKIFPLPPSWKERMQRKWNRMSPEEKEKFKERWKSRWWKMGYKPWNTEVSGDRKTTDTQ